MSTVVFFGLLLALIILRVPIGIALGVVALGFLSLSDVPIFTMIPERMAGGISMYIILAVPLFLLTGYLMNTGGVTKRIFGFADSLVGHIYGGLAHVNVIASLIFSGMSGSAIADAAGLGTIEINAMKDKGYDSGFSAAVTISSSIIGPIFPPSAPLIIFGITAGVSVVRLFMAGFVPGLLLTVGLLILVYFVARIRDYPVRTRAPIGEMLQAFGRAIWALLTPVLILVGIFGGYFSPTEAAAVAAIYTLFVSTVVYRELRLADLPKLFGDVAAETGVIMLLLAGGSVFGWVLTLAQIPMQVTNAMLSVTEHPVAILLLINALLLLIGTMFPPVPVILILSPILVPIAVDIGLNPVHFGIIMVFNLMLGLMTPPVGSLLYVSARIARCPVEVVLKSLLVFYPLFLLLLLAITFIPILSMWLPVVLP